MSVSRTLFASSLALATVCLSACVEDAEPMLGNETQGIEDGTLANSTQIARAGRLMNCSATRLTSRHFLTALHCNPRVGFDEKVGLYSSGTPYPQPDDVRLLITGVTIPPGTMADNGWDADWFDSNDQFADLAVITTPHRSLFPPAEVTPLHWKYPGEDQLALVVGNGEHNEDPSNFRILKQKYVYTSSGSDNDGDFYTHESPTNDGDSGGGLHRQGKLLGVTHGADYLIDGWHAQYTSVPEHLDFILGAIGYQWSGTTPAALALAGTSWLEVTGSQQRCQYACDHTSTCVGYNWLTLTNQCFLFSNVTGSSAQPMFRSATRTP